MSNIWKLTPRSKKSFYGSSAKNKISEMTNYYPNKTKTELEEDILNGTEALDLLAEKYKDLDYEKAFIKSLSLSEKARKKLFESVFKIWSQYTLKQLATIVGTKKLIRIMTYIKNTYPNDYNNRVLKRWPALENYV